MVTDALHRLLEYFELGGFVMPPLALSTLVLWYCVGLRWQLLRRGARGSVGALIERGSTATERTPQGIVDTAVVWGGLLERDNLGQPLRPILDDAFGEFGCELRRGRVWIRTIAMAAPLAGLLGTVVGMIETFDSLGEMALFTQTGGIAAGISQALFTTQMGLVVAVPGIVVGRILDRKERRLRDELEQVKDALVCGAATPAARRR